jgi:hypothetical protein
MLTPIRPTGIYLGVYCLSLSALLANANTTRSRRNFYVIFSSVLLLLNTISFSQLPYTGQMTWIVARNRYPGGPLEYLQFKSRMTPITLLGNVVQTFAGILNDGLLESLLIFQSIEITYLLYSLSLLINRYIAVT